FHQLATETDSRGSTLLLQRRRPPADGRAEWVPGSDLYWRVHRPLAPPPRPSASHPTPDGRSLPNSKRRGLGVTPFSTFHLDRSLPLVQRTKRAFSARSICHAFVQRQSPTNSAPPKLVTTEASGFTKRLGRACAH